MSLVGKLRLIIPSAFLAGSIYSVASISKPIESVERTQRASILEGIDYEPYPEDYVPYIAPIKNPSSEEKNVSYSEEELNELTKIIYAEAANQSPETRRAIIKLILNRVESSDYPNNVYDVIHQKNAFECITTTKSNLWKQASGKMPMNSYEKRVFNDCREDVEYVIEGNSLNIPGEDTMTAYHDNSIRRPNDSYWNSLDVVGQSDDIVFYAPKTKQ